MSEEKADLHSSKTESLRDLKTLEDESTPSLTPAEMKGLLHRIDLRLMPIMMAGWTLQFIDKVVLNYANIMGLQKDTGLKGDEFSWLATGFFIAFSIFQLPNSESFLHFSVGRSPDQSQHTYSHGRLFISFSQACSFYAGSQ